MNQSIYVAPSIYAAAPWIELVGGLVVVFAAGGLFGLVGAAGVIYGVRTITMRHRP